MSKIVQLIGAAALLALSTTTFGQARLMINDDAYVVMDGGVFIVLDNPNANALSTLGTGGNLVSEDEDNKVRWNIGTTTGTYVIPYTSNPATSNTKIPFTTAITSAGAGATGFIDFSSYETGTDNNSPWPSNVTHMNDALTGSINNTLYVIDRFWLVNSTNYTTNPSVDMTFGYIDGATEMGGTNTISEGNLRAQRFDDGNGIWGVASGGNYPMWGSIDLVNNRVSNVTPPLADFFGTWTLVDNSSPLPIDLVAFDSYCEGNDVAVSWSTASEQNNAYFTIERSIDNSNFEEIGTVSGAGTSSSLLHYSFIDENPMSTTAYYRVRQTNFNGLGTVHSAVVVDACHSDDNFNITVLQNGSGNINLGIQMDEGENVHVEIYDVGGKLILREAVQVADGYTTYELQHPDIATGYYMLNVRSQYHTVAKKIFLK